MAVSFNKRELQKKKEQKKQEKLKRKEERKASASGSFDDMIAYVDENGMITDTPPDPNKKQEIEIENIEVSTPKKEFVEEVPLIGRVDFFNPDKGFGFIKNTTNTEKYFFHISNAPANIAEGNKVSYELERGDRGMNAVKIVLEK
ncbi:cold-shock protein [Bacteroides reticulotermitis]|uniref:Cold shock protein CspA n=2 Tax=Bacteroides reticulotermitis TaxID=1133319 RepID=W4UUG7_9BACE|nr:cold shock domain-containing protein [Bacteroides reticulotermitis]MBB4045372.1 cold shock CspA family protein [Bacteroides reticulotermitis]GAE84149.1 cold shock protein CspA [Bacteroides reticulotermitis JCM 10512]HJD76312.1 cold shock domain-containing protein [Bacteroides reticulotermitis]